MKRIGILTFHRVANDGSVLQAYCLYKYLQANFPDAVVEIIDYRPYKISQRVYRSFITKKWPFWIQNNWKKFRAQGQFYQNFTKLSHDYVVTDDLKKATKYLEKQGYDAVFVGSDTVWDVRKDGGAPNVPNLYFLPHVSAIKKIAFAASMDKGEPEMLPDQVWRQQLEYVSEFDFISVRDEATRQKLTEGGIPDTDIHFMPDPTFLWNFSTISLLPKSIDINYDRLAGIAVADATLRFAMTQQLIKLGFSVVNLLGPANEDQLTLPTNFSLENRIGIYTKLKFMVTDRFHGSILTLKQAEAPVLLIEPSEYYPKPNSKGRDLFYRLGLQDMLWRCESYRDIPHNLVEQYVEKALHIQWPPTKKMNMLKKQGDRVLVEMQRKCFMDGYA